MHCVVLTMVHLIHCNVWAIDVCVWIEQMLWPNQECIQLMVWRECNWIVYLAVSTDCRHNDFNRCLFYANYFVSQFCCDCDTTCAALLSIRYSLSCELTSIWIDCALLWIKNNRFAFVGKCEITCVSLFIIHESLGIMIVIHFILNVPIVFFFFTSFNTRFMFITQ